MIAVVIRPRCCQLPVRLPLWVNFGSLVHASKTSVVGGKADEMGGKADIAF